MGLSLNTRHIWFQKFGIDYSETFSLVVKAPTIKVLFSLAVHFGQDIQQVDINNAFLNGELMKDVYISQPAGFVDSKFPSYVYKLKKSLYGLKQAPQAWYTKLRSALQGWGFSRVVSDASLFIKRTGATMLFLLVYVNDILVTSSDLLLYKHVFRIWMIILLSKPQVQSVIFQVLKHIEMLKVCTLHSQSIPWILDLLKKASMQDCKPCDTPLNFGVSFTDEEELFSNPSLYQTIIGSLQYLTHTRPDISFVVNRLSQFLSSPKMQHWLACKRLLRYLKGTIGLD